MSPLQSQMSDELNNIYIFKKKKKKKKAAMKMTILQVLLCRQPLTLRFLGLFIIISNI